MGNEKDLGTKKRQLQSRCSLLSSRVPKVCSIFCLFQVSISFMKSVIIKRQTILKRSFFTTMTIRKLTIPLSKEQEKRIKDLSMQYKEEEITALIEQSLSPLLDTVLSIMDAVIEENR